MASARHAGPKVAYKVQTYVEHLYPGVLASEISTSPVATRDIAKTALALPEGAYGFRFFDRTEATVDGEELLGKPKNFSPTYYPGGKIYTLEQVERGDLKTPRCGNDILIGNMRRNNFPRVVETRTGNVYPVSEGDQIIDLDASARSAARD